MFGGVFISEPCAWDELTKTLAVAWYGGGLNMEKRKDASITSAAIPTIVHLRSLRTEACLKLKSGTKEFLFSGVT
jgi:hypothetical protein